MTDFVYTFAYGMNMTPDTMSGAVEGQASFLPGYRLEYRQYADVVPAEGEVVPGVVWKVSRLMLANLDMREGYPQLYDRETVMVETADGKIVIAYVYRMTDRTRASYAAMGDVEISDRYRDMMIEGREHFGHSTDDIPAAYAPMRG